MVAPFVGAWIEILVREYGRNGFPVAPFVGAWIEILQKLLDDWCKESLRSSERGLKYQWAFRLCDVVVVAPFVGAWIEIEIRQKTN